MVSIFPVLVLSGNQFENLSLKELDEKFQEFISFYNQRFHEDIGETPNQGFQRALDEGRTRFRSLPKARL